MKANDGLDIVNHRFGKLIVTKYLGRRTMPDGKTKRHQYECVCDCGNVCIHTRPQLIRGYSKSCGCLCRKYGAGTIESRLYKEWVRLRVRGHVIGNNQSPTYDGVTVCDDWAYDFKPFQAWALANGYSDSLTLDRIDNSKGYSPDNCRWADKQTQTLNRKQTLRINGEYAKLVFERAKIKQTTYSQFIRRYFVLGWTLQDALEKPKHTHNGNHRTAKGDA